MEWNRPPRIVLIAVASHLALSTAYAGKWVPVPDSRTADGYVDPDPDDTVHGDYSRWGRVHDWDASAVCQFETGGSFDRSIEAWATAWVSRAWRWDGENAPQPARVAIEKVYHFCHATAIVNPNETPRLGFTVTMTADGAAATAPYKENGQWRFVDGPDFDAPNPTGGLQWTYDVLAGTVSPFEYIGMLGTDSQGHRMAFVPALSGSEATSLYWGEGL